MGIMIKFTMPPAHFTPRPCPCTPEMTARAKEEMQSLISQSLVNPIVTALHRLRQEWVVQRLVRGDALRRVEFEAALHELDRLELLCRQACAVLLVPARAPQQHLLFSRDM